MNETPKTPFHERVAWDQDGNLVVLDPYLAKRLPTLSPSRAKTVASCPARMVADSGLRPPFDVLGPSESGTAIHLVLEELMQCPPAERTKERAYLIRDDVAGRTLDPSDWQSVDYAGHLSDLSVRDAWDALLAKGIEGYFEIEDPTKANVYATEWKADNVELNGVPFMGIVDRVDQTASGEYVIIDYKSGAYKEPSQYGDDHGDQIRLYAEALTQLLGKKPYAAYLYYTGAGKKRRVSLAQPEMKKTLTDYRVSWDEYVRVQEARVFDTKGSALCGWCPLVAQCPTAQAQGRTDRKGGALAVEEGRIQVQSASPVGGGEPPVVLADSHPEDVPALVVAVEPVVEIPPVGQTLDVMLGVPSDSELVSEPVGDLVSPDARRNSAVTPELVVSESTAETNIVGETMNTTNDTQTVTYTFREGKAYDATVEGTNINLNGYGATGAFGISSLAVETLHRAGMQITKQTVESLSRTFSHILMQAQTHLTGRADWELGANSRMRGALRTALDTMPVPFGATAEVFFEWTNAMIRRVLSITYVALELLVNPNEVPAPQFDGLCSTPPVNTWTENVR